MNLKDVEEAAALKSNMHATFDTPQGKEVMEFLEKSCCWYNSCFDPSHPDLALINDGKRQVLATIKTILKCSPQQIAAMAK